MSPNLVNGTKSNGIINGGNSHARRACRIANCSGGAYDSGFQMLRAITEGPIDVVTGDYIAESNLAVNAEAMRAGEHPGFVQLALDGIKLSLDEVHKRGTKIVINGGCLNPKGLAEEVVKLLDAKSYTLKVGYVSGDDLFGSMSDVRLDADELKRLSQKSAVNKLVGINAYLGARAIRRGLDEGLDIIICK